MHSLQSSSTRTGARFFTVLRGLTNRFGHCNPKFALFTKIFFFLLVFSENCGTKFPKIFGKLVRKDDFQLCEQAVRSRVALRKEGQVELLGRRLNNLARRDVGLPAATVSTQFWRGKRSHVFARALRRCRPEPHAGGWVNRRYLKTIIQRAASGSSPALCS